jgi:hypothetical protein
MRCVVYTFWIVRAVLLVLVLSFMTLGYLLYAITKTITTAAEIFLFNKS